MSCRSAQKIKNRLENGGGVEDVEEMGIVRGTGLYGWKWSSLNCVSVQNPVQVSVHGPVQSPVHESSPVQSPGFTKYPTTSHTPSRTVWSIMQSVCNHIQPLGFALVLYVVTTLVHYILDPYCPAWGVLTITKVT